VVTTSDQFGTAAQQDGDTSTKSDDNAATAVKQRHNVTVSPAAADQHVMDVAVSTVVTDDSSTAHDLDRNKAEVANVSGDLQQILQEPLAAAVELALEEASVCDNEYEPAPISREQLEALWRKSDALPADGSRPCVKPCKLKENRDHHQLQIDTDKFKAAFNKQLEKILGNPVYFQRCLESTTQRLATGKDNRVKGPCEMCSLPPGPCFNCDHVFTDGFVSEGLQMSAPLKLQSLAQSGTLSVEVPQSSTSSTKPSRPEAGPSSAGPTRVAYKPLSTGIRLVKKN
jgi:hypothetical protein